MEDAALRRERVVDLNVAHAVASSPIALVLFCDYCGDHPCNSRWEDSVVLENHLAGRISEIS